MNHDILKIDVGHNSLKLLLTILCTSPTIEYGDLDPIQEYICRNTVGPEQYFKEGFLLGFIVYGIFRKVSISEV